MRKLNLDQLEVESFETSVQSGLRGTVQAHAVTDPPRCFTDEASCGGSCFPTNCDERTCEPNCTQAVTCGSTCTCPTGGITCEVTAPSPDGTCCHLTC